RLRLEGALGFEVRTQREHPARIRCGDVHFSVGSARESGDLLGFGFGESREYEVAVEFNHGSLVADTQQGLSVRAQSERVDQVIARSPDLLRGAVRGDAVNRRRA